MKKLTLTTILLLSAIWSFGQQKQLQPNKKGIIVHDKIDTSYYILNSSTNTWHLITNRYIFFNTPEEIMSISAPDSAGYITVKFSPKLVHFIDDSTFKFKKP